MHTIPRPTDRLLYPLLPCPAFDAYQRDVQRKDPAYLRLSRDNQVIMVLLIVIDRLTIDYRCS